MIKEIKGNFVQITYCGPNTGVNKYCISYIYFDEHVQANIEKKVCTKF